MKMTKKFLSILLSVIMALGVCAIAPFTASAAVGSLRVGDEDIDLEISGSYFDGKVEYDAATHTLTFNDFELEYGSSCISARYLDLTITGSAKLTSTSQTSDAIELDKGNLTISGDFTLRTQAVTGPALYVDGNLTVEGGSLNVISTATGAIYVSSRSMTVNGGSVYAKNNGSERAISARDIILPDESGEAFVLGDRYSSEVLIKAPGTLAGAGTEDNPYMLCDYTDLKLFASVVNGTNADIAKNKSAHAKLMKDIDASASETANDWTPIGNGSNKYTGTFDGKDSDGVMHKITGLTYNKSYADYAGLFGCVGEGGRVQNTGLEGGSITGKMYVGGVVGSNDGGAVTNCYNTGDVTSKVVLSYAGGVAGKNDTGTVKNCYNTGDVASAGDFSYAGGVVGFNDSGAVTNCYNTGTVSSTGKGSYTGGVAGYNDSSSVTNCYSTGDVTSAENYSYAGGVAGYITINGEASDCFYDSDRCTCISAIGSGSGTVTNVTGLTTDKMTGSNAISSDHMNFVFEDGEENPWLVKANDSDYSYYPHLKGFAYDSDPTAENWPPKTEAPVTTYPLWVGGAQVTSENMGDLSVIEGVSVAEGGWAKYEVKDGKNILYLKNATVTGTQTYDYAGSHVSNILIENQVLDLTINLEGENTLIGAERGIWMPNSSASSGLTLTGGGKLSITAEKTCVVINCDLQTDSADISLISNGDDYGNGTGIIANNIEIKNSSVYAEGAGDEYGIFCASSLSIESSTVEAKCTGTYGRGIYCTDKKDFTVSGDSVVIMAGGPRYGALRMKGSCVLENGNEIIEPANSVIKPLEAGGDVYAVFEVGGDNDVIAEKAVIAQPQTISLTASPANGGTVSGVEKTYKGAEVTVKATPETGYSFAGWTEGSSTTPVSTSTSYKFTVEGSRNLVANFAINTHTVSVSANPTEGGTVSGGGTYNYGGSATVTATPKDHYHFVSWTENSEEVSTDAEYTFTVDKDRNLTANFELDTFTIAFVNDDGTPLQSGSVAYGETPSYTGEAPTKQSAPEYTYTFAAWSPEITSVTGEATYTATYDKTPVDYKLTWVIDSENYKNETIPFGSNVSAPEVDEKAGYTFAWVDEIPETMPAQDVTINGKYTAIKYTATFVKEDGTELETREYDVETTSIDEPAVPEKAGYTGKWEDYELKIGGITVKPVYTNISGITLNTDGISDTTGYKEDQTFTVDTSNLPEGAEVHWFVNGEDAGTGSSYTVEDPTEDYTVQAKVIDKDGNVLAETEEQKVTVKNGFFDRLKAFFAELIEKILGKAIADLLSSVC